MSSPLTPPLDTSFVCAVLREGDPAYSKAVERGITPENHLFGDAKKAWEYIVKHRKQYGQLPSQEVVVGQIGTDLVSILSDKSEVFLDALLTRRLHSVISEGISGVGKKLEARDPQGAAEAVTELQRKVTQEKLTVSRVESLLALGKEVIEYYENVKAGMRGIPTPWPTMTEQTWGWKPEDLLVFVGRLGVGKTWTLLLIAHKAWQSGSRVLITSTEMNRLMITMRFFALHFKIPYGDLLRGKLGEFVEDKFKSGIESILNDQGIYIVGGDFDFTIDNLEGAVEECEASLAAIDAPYLIKNTGKDRHEIVSNTFNDFKRICKRRKLVLATNTQFNRQAKTGKDDTIVAENVGMTDVAGWNADIMYGLKQTDEERANGLMGIKSIKIREGVPTNFMTHWDLKLMDFEEVRDADAPPPADNSPSGGSDDFSDLPF